MIKPISKHHPAICLISVIGMLFTSADLHADESVSLSTQVAEETEGFLSDPARAGSLIGTILAGAALANPLSPILGSVAGYFIGKDTDYTNSNKAQQNAYARRSLIPENDSQIASLSGLTSEQPSILAIAEEPGAGEQPQQAEQPNMLELVEGLGAGEQPQTAEQSIKLGLPRKTVGKGNLQQQLAYACSHVKTTQQLPVYCYYYSQ